MGAVTDELKVPRYLYPLDTRSKYISLGPEGQHLNSDRLFDSGVLHYYDYAHLYNTSTKIVARTTSENRMLQSAEYFLAGFFGLTWTNNASIEVIIEEDGYNNSLAGYDQCNNSNLAVSEGGTNASDIWEKTYLANATARFNAMSSGYTWNTSDAYK